jgi:TRAP-type uncharacterized transport system fused permease subunit
MCLFMQVDAMAARRGLAGLPKSELPRFWPALRLGWIFVLPLATLIYLLFFAAYSAQFAALACSLLLLVLALLRGRLRSAHEWSELIFDGGANLVPLILIGGAAGVIDGIMNATGLGQSLSYILVLIGSQWGLFATLLLTATLSIVLGLGMPSTAIYVLLASVIAPALVEMGVTPLGAHLFIFYFGVMSFLTPPVAVSSYVAAGIAQADMWRTGWVGMQLSGIACVLPFLWVYDPALLLQGSVLAIAVVTCTTFSAILLIASAIRLVRDRSASSMALAIFLCAAVAAVGTSPIWLGHESMLALAAAAAGVVLYWVLPRLFEPTREIVV